ncbi:putative mitochondrial hypothetical protein [Leptomonas pyrrhocoris]|uniref:Uncharacterized protein n=1 Tax=Leptomonas pyrrhocoris TaxID=157538 RepID=A0A0N0VD33_LEPPY|nr:putative mitochondrial hypothetical protein [Leptomonas pyrrhocoris]KPA74174.1 putative mitochondrial hypothetical protein [Leptomonas pyrrhocoris]|eukprot:XP_015652613.1 putative mitochondrial hypothetical protein [Leptomonas pyrrhocoris]
MLRRTWTCFMTLAEAQRLVDDVSGRPASIPSTAATATATLPNVLSALTEHYRQGGEAFTRAALQRVVQLDQSNEDTQHVADTCLSDTSTGVAAATATTTEGVAAQPASRHLITELLRTYPHSPEIRERCCRCIANVCQLGTDTASDDGNASASHNDAGVAVVASQSSSDGAYPPSHHSPLADALVDEGAVELILGTLVMAGRLSPRGRCWAAMAMLNITCMSHNGAARATKAGAVDRVAEYILFLLDDAAVSTAAAAPAATTAASSSAGPVRGLSEETAIALDAALGALTALLAAEAPENASGISFNYEAASYVAVDAVVRALLFTSALLVRDGRNDGAYGASLPARRYGTVVFPAASVTQQTAVVVLLPLLHKAWMALQEVSSCPTNLPMVFDVVYEAANANQESMVVESESVTGGSEEVLEVTAQTERQYVAALSSMIDAALFVTTELEGLDAIGAEELVRLQKDVQLNVMDTMQSMTASRKDLARKNARECNSATTGVSNSSIGVEEDHPGDSDAAADASGVYPTAAAMGVTDVLASGTVSNMALACAVRLHTEHREHRRGGGGAEIGAAAVAAPYNTHDFTLLSRSLVVLANVAEVGDEAATSANAVAALQTILVDAVEDVVALPRTYKSDLADLFKPTDDGEHASPSSSCAQRGAIREADRLIFLQQAALVGQVYAVLWSTLRTAQGVATVSQLRVLQTAKEVQMSLRESYLPAVEAAKMRHGASSSSSPLTDERTSEEAAAAGKKEAWVPNTVEETVVRLLKLSDELIDNLSRLAETNRSAGVTLQ